MEELENCDPPQKIGKVGVKISNGTFCWDLTKQTNPALSDVNMSVNEGQLFMIVGTVGSGKTTLLTSILGSIPKTTGTFAFMLFFFSFSLFRVFTLLFFENSN